MRFLSARWEHLLLANYSVAPEVLAHHVPQGTQIDEFEGQVFVSLVAFMFNRTRVVGFPIPFHRSFEEVNLRFYVVPTCDRSKRAVTFIKEIVPRKAIPLIANNLFHENYVAWPMNHRNDPPHHSYSWNDGSLRNDGAMQTFTACVDAQLDYPQAGSLGEFITEHYWGYARAGEHTLEYQVEHPQWKCCDVDDYQIEVDFDSTYGDSFAFLNEMRPTNVQYALGSDVGVSFPRRLV